MTKVRKTLHETNERKTKKQSENAVKKNTKKKPTNKWTEHEYSALINLVRQNGEDWNRISMKLENKTAKQCMQKFKNSQRSAKKGNWTSQEDDLLFSWVEQYGPTKWTECSKEIKGRCGKQCRERWVNILNPDVKKGNWSDYEQDVIFNNLSTYNTSWSAMSHILPGRTENSIKNYFYSSVRRLKSNNILHLLKNIYVYKKQTSQEVLENNVNVLNDINKLNRLSQKICHFLFEKDQRNEGFLNFLLSVLFGSETVATTAENEIKKLDSAKGFVPVNQKNLFVPCEKRDLLPSCSLQLPMIMDSKMIYEALSKFVSCPENSHYYPFIKEIEKKLPNSIIVHNDKKTEVRLTSCWNCKTEMCSKHTTFHGNK